MKPPKKSKKEITITNSEAAPRKHECNSKCTTRTTVEHSQLTCGEQFVLLTELYSPLHPPLYTTTTKLSYSPFYTVQSHLNNEDAGWSTFFFFLQQASQSFEQYELYF